MPKKQFQIGERVRYSSEFLRSIACYTGDLPQLRGTIAELVPLGSSTTLAKITWDNVFPDDDFPTRVNVANLERCR